MDLGARAWGSLARSTCCGGDLVPQGREKPNGWSQASFDRNEGENTRRPPPRVLACRSGKWTCGGAQAATSEVLRIIAGSPGDLDAVFQAILRNATRICEAKFANLFL